MLKCDFHLHSSDDPRDVLDHSTFELIDHAARLGYGALALTFHGRLFCPDNVREYAQARGILLIPGIEFFVDGVEALILGCTIADLSRVRTFRDLAGLRKARGGEVLVIIPHPFYGLGHCAGDRMEKNVEAFDAIEFCHFYTTWLNPNQRAEQVSRRLGKPMIACSDTHRLQWMGNHYCLLDAEPTKESVFAAIRAGRIQNISRPLTTIDFLGRAFWHLTVADTRKLAVKLGLRQHAVPRDAPDVFHPSRTEKQ